MICPILLQLPTWSARLVHLSGSRAAQRIVTYQVNFFFLFSIFVATFRTENNYCHGDLAGGELPAVSPNWMFDASLRIEKIDQKIVSVNDIDVRDAVMTSATLILSGTPNPQSTRTIVSIKKVVIGLVLLGF